MKTLVRFVALFMAVLMPLSGFAAKSIDDVVGDLGNDVIGGKDFSKRSALYQCVPDYKDSYEGFKVGTKKLLVGLKDGLADIAAYVDTAQADLKASQEKYVGLIQKKESTIASLKKVMHEDKAADSKENHAKLKVLEGELQALKKDRKNDQEKRSEELKSTVIQRYVNALKTNVFHNANLDEQYLGEHLEAGAFRAGLEIMGVNVLLAVAGFSINEKCKTDIGCEASKAMAIFGVTTAMFSGALVSKGAEDIHYETDNIFNEKTSSDQRKVSLFDTCKTADCVHYMADVYKSWIDVIQSLNKKTKISGIKADAVEHDSYRHIKKFISANEKAAAAKLPSAEVEKCVAANIPDVNKTLNGATNGQSQSTKLDSGKRDAAVQPASMEHNGNTTGAEVK
jgi:hypothetical protein